MNVLVSTVADETVIKNSRFIAELFPCTSQEQAREILKEQKTKYSDASHVCHAFVLGDSAQILGMSDAGEPSGTAGRPMLDVLKGHSCTNTILTVTRYFGGTLLGTGGLVKAYSGAAKSVLEKADALDAFELLVKKKSFSFSVSYQFYDAIKRYLSTLHIYELAEDFQTDIEICAKVREDEADLLLNQVFDLTRGESSVKFF